MVVHVAASPAQLILNVLKAKRILTSSTHPRKREQQARHLLHHVLKHNIPVSVYGPSEISITETQPKSSAVLKALTEAVSASVLDEESICDLDSFQLSFDNDRGSPAQTKTLQQMRENDIQRQQQRDSSFHGYEQTQRSFLDVSGAAARIPRTITKQLRGLKLNAGKAKKKLEDERKQGLVEILQEQQAYTRAALHQHQQLSLSLQQQKHPRTVSTQVLALDSIKADRDNETEDRKVAIAPFQLPDSYYEEKLLDGMEHPQRPILTTFNIDARELFASLSCSNNHEEVLATTNDEDFLGSSNRDDDNDQIRRRLGDRQREVFATTAGNGLFLGGGFISKKSKDKYAKKTEVCASLSNNRLAQAASEREFLEAVLDAQSAPILPLAEANKPALRRRDASAGRRHPSHHKSPDKH